MMIKSHLQGRDEKERWKEVMLEEHTEVKKINYFLLKKSNYFRILSVGAGAPMGALSSVWTGSTRPAASASVTPGSGGRRWRPAGPGGNTTGTRGSVSAGVITR